LRGLNPNSVLVNVSSGWINAFAGPYAEGITDLHHAYRINPLAPDPGHSRRGHVHFLFALNAYEALRAAGVPI